MGSALRRSTRPRSPKRSEIASIVSSKYAPLDPEELVSTIRTALVRIGMLDEVRVKGVASGLVDNMRLVVELRQVGDPRRARDLAPRV